MMEHQSVRSNYCIYGSLHMLRKRVVYALHGN